MTEEGQAARDMVQILERLDDRFAIDEMIPATDLQTTAVSKLVERISQKHKLLITHYNKPVGVLLGAEVFSAMVRELQELRARLKEEEADRQLIEERLAKNIPFDQWLTHEQFMESAEKILDEHADPKTGE